ncbi:MAG: CDP-diacylglycerol--glycerol-3-phosphate 3-phosphatidyltransferase [Clostridiales Family XIII bacterium]|jgi:CDP-diacylglycerol--glycerol-3-phosphate 3-phosphatidyltransferase|nr:CDP-diacylglycerol--glycerol-3-phosphate 3-phosphatidyltransferase [Clostridiales Family XIII bacterium]
MNLPNALTLLRMAMVPVFIVLFYQDMPIAAAVVFILAAITDAADGKIARARNQITNFGKLMDPLADKVLTVSAFICLVDSGQVAAWMVIVILAREFAITGLRSVAASEGQVIAAGMSGKLKTVFQMVAIALLLLHNWPFSYLNLPIDQACLWIAIVLTIYSGVEYIVKGRHLLTMK